MHDASKGTILIVDDNPGNLAVLFNYLKETGFRLLVSQSGNQALSIVHDNEIDLILLDIMMPDMSGYDICKKLKSYDDIRDIPVIFISALSQLEDKVKGFEVGGVDYITKPFYKEEILARINTHLTLRKRENQLKKVVDTLKAINTEKDSFLRIVAHDLKDPLGGIREILPLLNSLIDMDPDKAKHIIRDLHRTAVNTFNFVHDLLTWARNQNSLGRTAPEQFSPWSAVEDTVVLFSQNLSNKDVTLVNNVDPEVTVWADKSMVYTVFRNLISNAIKFIYPGGKIQVDCSTVDSMVEICVADDGVGIKEDLIHDLFRMDRKIQMDGTGGEKGTGLGLLLVKDHVEKNGGTIRVESVEGQGSSFYISLPVDRTV